MENIENLFQIYEQLRSCTNLDEVETLKKSLNRSNVQSKEVEKESDGDSSKNGGSKELGIRNVRKSLMLSVAEKSREVDKLRKEVKELVEMNKFGEDLTIEVPEEIQVKFPTKDLGEKFCSHVNEILDLLTKNMASAIGVWGEGGVGKTTLIKHVHNIMQDQSDTYGSVYWITVSKDCSIQKLQTNITESIKVSISNTLDESKRAGILAETLKMKKKSVLILDDMWSDFDLNEVGLGLPKEIGYRLIVTSQSKNVCSKMYCDNIIKINPLSIEDAQTLFVKSIGGKIPNDLTKISIDMLEECAGLPRRIITLANNMIRGNDVGKWRKFLEDLRNSNSDRKEKLSEVLRLSSEPPPKDWEITYMINM